jgi:hypothetical protein
LRKPRPIVQASEGETYEHCGASVVGGRRSNRTGVKCVEMAVRRREELERGLTGDAQSRRRSLMGKGGAMPPFMDIHETLPEGAGAKNVAEVHREAHGLVADRIIQVEEGS